MITHEQLKSFLHYDPEMGIFVWMAPNSRRVHVGYEAGCLRKVDGYIQIMINRRLYLAHRLAWLYVHGLWPKDQIDHINGVKDDNRIANLREATRSQNMYNQGKRTDNSSGVKGISWHKPAKKWLVQIRFNGKNKYLGLFTDKHEAAESYRRAALLYHGEFANTEGKESNRVSA